MNKEDTLLIGVNFLHGVDAGFLIVGKKRPNEQVDIINSFHGKEALELYKKLITEKKEEAND